MRTSCQVRIKHLYIFVSYLLLYVYACEPKILFLATGGPQNTLGNLTQPPTHNSLQVLDDQLNENKLSFNSLYSNDSADYDDEITHLKRVNSKKNSLQSTEEMDSISDISLENLELSDPTRRQTASSAGLQNTNGGEGIDSIDDSMSSHCSVNTYQVSRLIRSLDGSVDNVLQQEGGALNIIGPEYPPIGT